MKQLLFLLLFPCLAMAQYQGNGNQKITLGEQTTADGLVFRGVENDTAFITPFSDTSAYIILDTINNKFYNYNRSTNVWSLAGGGGGGGGGTGTVTSITAGTGLTGGTITTSGTLAADTNFLVTRFDTSSMLNNYYRSGRALGIPSSGTLTNATGLPLTTGITGTLGGGNGGTGLTTFGAANRVLYSASTTQLSTSANLTFDETTLILRKNTTGYTFETLPNISVENPSTSINSFAAIRISANNNGIQSDFFADGLGAFGTPRIALRAITNHPFSFYTNNTERMRINNDAEVWIGYNSDGARGTFPLQVNGQIFATNATIATSDEKFKENITPLNKGLEIVNKLKPVTFNFISDTENNFSEYEEVGFIAQDVDRALSTETFAKSIVKNADDSEPTSTMGLVTSNLIPILVKAIQEQQALIKALEQRILILENK